MIRMRWFWIILFSILWISLGACGTPTVPAETDTEATQQEANAGKEVSKDAGEPAQRPDDTSTEFVQEAISEKQAETSPEAQSETNPESQPELGREAPPTEPTAEKTCQKQPEICDGKDNDCNGKIDEGLVQPCYTGAKGTRGKGRCKAGIQACQAGKWGACQGEVTPGSPFCGRDQNCDGKPDCNTHAGDIGILLSGIKKIAAPGVPGALVVFGHNAFPVAAGTSANVKDPVAAAAKWGKGRIFIYSHGGYMGAQDLKYETTGQLLKNAVHWLAYGATKPVPRQKIAVVGRISTTYLQQQKYNVTKLSTGWDAKLSSYQVLIIKAATMNTAKLRQAVLRFVEKGGGLLMAETGWGWAQLNPRKSIVNDFAGNILLREVGLAWTADAITDGKPGYDNTKPPSDLLHAQKALDLLEKQAEGKKNPSAADLAQATHTVTRAIPYLYGSDKLLRPRIEQLLKKYGAQIIPSAKNPVKTQDGLKRVLLAYQLIKSRRLPPEQVKAHPAAEVFPGKVPTRAKRVTQSLTIDTTIRDWHSTGLYAAPGEVVTVSIPSKAAKKGLSLRIGAHKDRLWSKDSWRRAPEITQTWALTTNTTKAASAFGGLLYIVVPKNSKLGIVKVTITNAVQVPYFVMGKTKVTDWNKTIRQYPAPWAELANSKLVLTVPSTAIRQLTDPDKLMQYWDKVMNAAADLATIPRARARPERIVMDEQISAGYMHAGYPIMTHLDVRKTLPNTAYITQKGGWGIFHEIGHNHQSRYWTFNGTGEVTENLFTLYIFEFVHNNKKPRASLYGTARTNQIKSYIKNGTKFSEWQRKSFLALIMYMQLQEGFGWKTYKKVFTDYRNAPANQLPKTDAEERDQWMVRFSKAVGKNLGPFFQAWGVPTTRAARQSIANLPKWMPSGFPPRP